MAEPPPQDDIFYAKPRSGRLKANAVGPWGLAALAIGITSPAIGLYALWGPMQVAAGPVTPLIFLAAMILTLPTAISYACLNRETPSAGAACTWLWSAVSPLLGIQGGLLMTTYFIMAAVAQPLMFALFFQDLVTWLGVAPAHITTLVSGVLISSLPIAWICLRGAASSVKSTIRLMILETIVVLALSLTIIVVRQGQGNINWDAFDPHRIRSLMGFWDAMILGVLAFCGFDVVSTAAEEAHAPREHLPKAILLTILGMGAFWAMNAWAFTLSTSDDQVRQYTTRGLTAVTGMAQHYWGGANLIIILTAFTGLTAVYISSMQGASRIVFALARHGIFPRALAHLTGAQHVPRNAVLAVLVAVITLDLFTLFVLRNGLESFTWWANALVFFATLTFLCVNIANVVWFRRFARPRFGLVKNLLIPIIGISVNAYLIYAAFFVSLWHGDWRTGKSVVVASMLIVCCQFVALVYVRVCKRSLLIGHPPLAVDTQG